MLHYQVNFKQITDDNLFVFYFLKKIFKYVSTRRKAIFADDIKYDQIAQYFRPNEIIPF